MSQTTQPSHHDLLGLDEQDDTDSDPPTGVHDMRDLNGAKMLFLHQGQKIKQAEKRALRIERALRISHGVATEALDTSTRIETTITSAINTLKVVGAIVVAVGGLVSALAAGIGYALAHFTLH